ncbi:GAT domain [Dillenia turbinata]|uniref:GAT domain n=1 Tax=Dillenia turbinata TaxID=194707 RepID=A0AAN8YR16_9MAGN
MVHPLVERATSDMLMGPDWAKNLEICDILNRDPMLAKEVCRGLRRRIRSKNAKVQLLALTLLETMVKNCSDIIHMHIAEKDIPSRMVKVAKKKQRDPRVREKIVFLINSWNEAFGGARARYPQYYIAYQKLLHAGLMYCSTYDKSAPIFTPIQTHPLTYPGDYDAFRQQQQQQQESAEGSEDPEFPTLSLNEIEKARDIINVLAEMINAIEPENKEAFGEEVILDLVQQCRTYKQRVVHLINSTSDESLLGQGLKLNDDLQRLLAKHEALVSGNPVEPDKSNSDQPLIDLGDGDQQPGDGSTSKTKTADDPLQLLLPDASTSNGSSDPNVNSKIDLLSGESTEENNPLAIVPVGDPGPSGLSQQNPLTDMPYHDNPAMNSDPQLAFLSGQGYPMTLQTQGQNIQGTPFGMHPNGNVPNTESPRHQQQDQPQSPGYGSAGGGAFPPPPWETQTEDNMQLVPGNYYPQQPGDNMQLVPANRYPQHPADNTQMVPSNYPQQMQVTQVLVTHTQPTNNGMHPQHPYRSNQVVGMFVQPITNGQLTEIQNQHMQNYYQYYQGNQVVGMQMQGPGMYAEQIPGFGSQQMQYLDQNMQGLSVSDNNVVRRSSYNGPSSGPMRGPPRPEDKLFGDLVNMAKTKPK